MLLFLLRWHPRAVVAWWWWPSGPGEGQVRRYLSVHAAVWLAVPYPPWLRPREHGPGWGT